MEKMATQSMRRIIRIALFYFISVQNGRYLCFGGEDAIPAIMNHGELSKVRCIPVGRIIAITIGRYDDKLHATFFNILISCFEQDK